MPTTHLKLFAFVILLGGTVCHASTIAYSYTGSPLGQATGAGAVTLGFKFTTLQNVVVDSLGLMDVGQNGLAGTEEVGIWNSAGTLLFSADLGTGTLEGPVLSGGQFSYTPITPLFLAGGQTYTIGAQLDLTDDLLYGGSQTSAVPSLLSVSGSSFQSSSLTFSDPTVTAVNLYDLVSFTVATTPEPVSAALALSGLAATLLFRRRK